MPGLTIEIQIRSGGVRLGGRQRRGAMVTERDYNVVAATTLVDNYRHHPRVMVVGLSLWGGEACGTDRWACRTDSAGWTAPNPPM
jgi:hypothetical protein